MNPIQILRVSKEFEVQTKYGAKNKVNITFKELSTGQEMDGSYFVDKRGVFFSPGDEVVAEVTKRGQYININKIEPFGTQIDTFKGENASTSPLNANTGLKSGGSQVSNDVWEKKDERMARMNALRHGVEIVRLSLESKHERDVLQPGEVYNLVEMIADNCMDYIYKER